MAEPVLGVNLSVGRTFKEDVNLVSDTFISSNRFTDMTINARSFGFYFVSVRLAK